MVYIYIFITFIALQWMLDKFTYMLRIKGPGGNSICFSLDQLLDPCVATLVLVHNSFEFSQCHYHKMGNGSKELWPSDS